MTRVALRYWKLDPDKDVSFFQSGNTPTRTAALIAQTTPKSTRAVPKKTGVNFPC